MFWPIIARGFYIQAATDVVLDIIDFITDVDRRMMIIPGDIDNSSFGSFLEKLAFFIALCVLPRVFDNKRNLEFRFTMCFPPCRCSTRDARCPHHQYIENETLGLTVFLYLDESLAVFRADGRIESILFLLAHP